MPRFHLRCHGASRQSDSITRLLREDEPELEALGGSAEHNFRKVNVHRERLNQWGPEEMEESTLQVPIAAFTNSQVLEFDFLRLDFHEENRA